MTDEKNEESDEDQTKPKGKRIVSSGKREAVKSKDYWSEEKMGNAKPIQMPNPKRTTESESEDSSGDEETE